MNIEEPVPCALVKGRITVWNIDDETGEKVELFTKTNLIMYKWGWIAAKCLGHGDSAYKLSAMYFEYSNVASPGDTVSAPVYARGDGISYYSGLANPKDFLRVPLSSLPSITVESGYSSYFTGSEGNVMNFFAQTSGTAGILTRPFANANNSKVYGLALVATPTWSDRTKDLIFARTYLSSGDQQLKLSGSQIGVTWSIPLL